MERQLETNHLLVLMQKIENVRNFISKPLKENDKTCLYKAYSYGHSSMGNFAREMLVVEKQSIRNRVVESTLSPYMTKEQDNQSWIENVPFLAITLIDKKRAIARVGQVGVKVAEREAEGALQNLRLIATTLDIGTTVVREFNEKVLQDNLELPWYVKPIAIIAGGYSNNLEKKSPHLHYKEIIHKDEWI